jgi:PAS domain S-box-containing protein
VFVDAADPMLLLDDNRRLVDANRAACTLFGLAKDSVAARVLDDLVLDDPRQLDELWRELLALGEVTREHRVPTTGHGERLVEGSYRAFVEPRHHLCIARDITEQRRLEERLVQSEKMESVGRLAGGIAHDFNNLLTAILGYTDLLLSSHGPDDPDRADLEEIQKAGQRAAALTQQLLAYSRKQVLLPREVDLNDIVSKLQGMLKRLIREDISLVCELSPEPAIVRVDPTQMEQVIVNLVLNARDALPAAGTIRLEVARLAASQVMMPAEQSTRALEYVRLRVIDDGVGITPEVRAHLFEPFFTTKGVGKGTGLGLASAYGFVRQSQGFIDVASSPGRGATFTVHMPLAADSLLAQLPAPALSAPSGGHETILLVEDEESVRHVVSTVLQRQGYRVLDAATPQLACELFDRHAKGIDLLLTDVVMPVMSGPALAQRLVALRPEMRVLFISGYSDTPWPFGADNPNISFLGKPFQAPALAAKVREVLSRPRSGARPSVKE